ncbi:MAG: [Fe-Fe] hydrogenase large subunit C-terminal domain-containing protein, partial [Planctomycetota bacterium]
MPPIISTAATVCQDCYKCLRECPAKAIRVHDGAAQVEDELCIKCGHCVTACPAGAKQVRDDVPLVRELLAGEEAVWCSIAPSWLGEFPETDAPRLCAALRALGFAGVSETALGAQEVSAHTAALLAAEPDRLWLSSACPSAVAWATRYADCGAAVTPLLSPLLTHALMLRQRLQQPIRVVFVGPCIAKKMEVEKRPDLLDAAIGFTEVSAMFEAAGIDPSAPAPDDAGFWPEQASDGALYPVEGGMLAGIRDGCGVAEAELAAVAGLPALREALAEPAALEGVRFLELLACPGGCIGGPCRRRPQGSLGKRRRIIATAPAAEMIPRRPSFDIHMDWSQPPVPVRQHDEASIARALAQVGKYAQEDELNCG